MRGDLIEVYMRGINRVDGKNLFPMAEVSKTRGQRGTLRS